MIAALLRAAASTPSPTPTTPSDFNPDTVTPGFVGFIITFLIAVAAFAYAVTPIAPRWSVRLEHPATARLLGDGRVLTMPDAERKDRDRSGPAAVFDTATGARLS